MNLVQPSTRARRNKFGLREDRDPLQANGCKYGKMARQNVGLGGSLLSEESRDNWIAVLLGNSRSLWGSFAGDRLLDWQRCLPGLNPAWNLEGKIEIVLAEVGHPERRSSLFDRPEILPRIRTLTPEQVPLQGQYRTLGLDRSLALVGAASEWGWPLLVVDGGTALTISAADEQGRFVGGAILPGLGLQGRALHEHTAALPNIQLSASQEIPPRWATSTPEAIRSGIYFGTLAAVRSFCREWRDRYPHSALIFTGGDGELLHRGIDIDRCYYDPVVVLKGIAVCRRTGERISP